VNSTRGIFNVLAHVQIVRQAANQRLLVFVTRMSLPFPLGRVLPEQRVGYRPHNLQHVARLQIQLSTQTILITMSSWVPMAVYVA